MSLQQEAQPAMREIVFGDDGMPISESAAAPPEPAPEPEPIEVAPPPEPTLTPAQAPPKYRIGDAEFATSEEALAFARTQVASMEREKEVAAAYRQGIQDAVTHPGQPQNVTPAVTPPQLPKVDDPEFYASPTAYLQKYGQQIQAATEQSVRAQVQAQMAAGQAWLDFSARHPELADFRTEVEAYADAHKSDLQGIFAVRGKEAGFDYIATKLKTQFSKYGEAVKPKRELPNTTTNTPAATQSRTVTPKTGGEKPLSFPEQIKQHLKKNKR